MVCFHLLIDCCVPLHINGNKLKTALESLASKGIILRMAQSKFELLSPNVSTLGSHHRNFVGYKNAMRIL